MKITKLLDRPIAYHRCFVTLTGSVKAAILLSQAVYWQERAKQEDGYWYKTIEEWQEETGLTDHEQRTARKDCAKYLLSDLRGVPAQLFYKVDEEALEADLLPQTVRTSSAESAEQVGHKPQNIKRNAETTSENTPEENKKLPTPRRDRTDQEQEELDKKKLSDLLGMAEFSGAKRESRIQAILEYSSMRLNLKTTSNAWREFARMADTSMQDRGEKIEDFMNWLLNRPNFNPDYWSPQKMGEHWGRAFSKNEDTYTGGKKSHAL